MVEMVEKAPPAEWAGEPDYTVTQIIQFVPKAPELMYAEVWLTDRDCLGLGIEPYERLASSPPSTEKFANVQASNLHVPPARAISRLRLQSVASEDLLSQGPWVLGEKFSAADVMIGSDLMFGIERFKIVGAEPDRSTAT